MAALASSHRRLRDHRFYRPRLPGQHDIPPTNVTGIPHLGTGRTRAAGVLVPVEGQVILARQLSRIVDAEELVQDGGTDLEKGVFRVCAEGVVVGDEDAHLFFVYSLCFCFPPSNLEGFGEDVTMSQEMVELEGLERAW